MTLDVNGSSQHDFDDAFNTRPSDFGAKLLTNLLIRVRDDLLVRNALILMVNTGVTSVFGLVFWVIASNRQTPVQLGLASAMISLLPFAATLGGLGLDSAVFRHYAQSLNQKHLVRRAMLLCAAGACLIGFIVGAVRHGNTNTAIVATLTMIAGGALGANAITTSVIIASRRTGLLLIESIISSTLKVGALLIFPSDQFGLLVAAIIGIVSSAVVSATVVTFIIRPGVVDPNVRDQVNGYAASNWISASFSLLPFATLPAVVLWRAGAEPAALVAVAALISPLLRLIPSTIMRSFFAEVAASPERLRALAKRTLRYGLITTALAAGTLAIIAPYILSLFGTTYRDGSTPLVRYLALAATIAVFNYLSDAVLNLKHDHRAYMATNVFGMTCLMAFIVIGAVHGASGIGLAWITGETLYAIVAWTTIYIRHGRHTEPATRPI